MAMKTTAQLSRGVLERGIAVLMVLLFFAGCGAGPPEDLLDRMTGTWETDAAGYKGAQLEISRTKVIFHAIDDTLLINRIADINHRVDKTGDLLTIEYYNEFDQKYLLTFYLLNTPDGDRLVKKNQPHIIWEKVP